MNCTRYGRNSHRQLNLGYYLGICHKQPARLDSLWANLNLLNVKLCTSLNCDIQYIL